MNKLLVVIREIWLQKLPFRLRDMLAMNTNKPINELAEIDAVYEIYERAVYNIAEVKEPASLSRNMNLDSTKSVIRELQLQVAA